MRRFLPVVQLTLCVCLCVPSPGCARQNGGAEAGTLQGAVLVLFDTVRADHLSCYGYSRNTSPSMDRLAEKGVRFEQAVSNSPWTLPSAAGLLAGDYPERAFQGRLTRSLVEQFAAAGVATGAVTEGGYVSRAFGMDRGFADYAEEQGPVQLLRSGEQMDPGFRGGIENTFATAREWLRQHKDERFFLLVHTYEPHTPYTNHDFTTDLDPGAVGPVFGVNELIPRLQAGELTLSEQELEYVTALYDGGIAKADRELGSLLSLLEELGLDDRTLVAVTSDHGEELGDHYPSRTGDHGHSLRDPLLHIPLILHDPTGSFAVRSVPWQVRLIDVMPTIAERMRIPLAPSTEGRSLVPFLEGTENEDRLVVASQTKAGPQRVSIRHRGFKYIATVGPAREGHGMLREPASRQLYDLRSDPREQHNLVGERPEMARMLEIELRGHLRQMSGSVDPGQGDELDPDVLERLKSLGYIR